MVIENSCQHSLNRFCSGQTGIWGWDLGESVSMIASDSCSLFLEWHLMWSSADVAQQTQGSMCCVFWDAFLLTPVVKSDHLSYFNHSPLISLVSKVFQPAEPPHTGFSIFTLFCVNTRVWCVKFPEDMQFLKYQTILCFPHSDVWCEYWESMWEID